MRGVGKRIDLMRQNENGLRKNLQSDTMPKDMQNTTRTGRMYGKSDFGV